MKEEPFLNLTDLSALFPELGRNVLSSYASVHDILPFHTKQGTGRHYYKESEVKRTLKALEPLRAKGIPLRFCRTELMRLNWYRELRDKQ